MKNKVLIVPAARRCDRERERAMIRPPTVAGRRFGDALPIAPTVEQAIPWGSPVGHAPVPIQSETRLTADRAETSFDAVYRACYVDVARWVRALGANDADVEDLTQEVFIIVRRKLAGFDGRNLPGFLYRIAQRTVRDHRHSAWFRHLLGKPTALPQLTSPGPNGLQLMQHQERRRVLDTILARMSEKR